MIGDWKPGDKVTVADRIVEHKCIHRLREMRLFRCYRCNATHEGQGFLCTLRGSECPVICQACFEHPPAPPATPKGPGGMDLRDWFAGMAMQLLVTPLQAKGWQLDYLASEAYILADAMLEARNPDAT